MSLSRKLEGVVDWTVKEGMACLKTVMEINEKLKDARLTKALKGVVE